MSIRRFTISVLLALGAGLVMIGNADPAYAACAESPDIVEALTEADVVFVGSVYSVSSNDRIAVMEVVEVWKGPDLQAAVGVHGDDPHNPGVGPDDRTFEVGRTYLVVPENGKPPFQDSLCTATMLYRPTGEIPPEYKYAVGASQVRYTESAEAAMAAPTAIEVLSDYANSAAVWWGVGVAFVLGIGFIFYKGGAKRRKEKPETTTGVKPRLSFAGMFNRSGADRLRKLRSRAK